MTLYKGQQKVAPIINTATTINNQNKVFNSNGIYTCDEEYTGLGQVEVSVPEKVLEETTIEINNPNETINLEPQGFDGYSSVTISTNVPLQEKTYVITQEDLDNTVISIVPDENYYGITKINIDFSTLIELLKEV